MKSRKLAEQNRLAAPPASLDPEVSRSPDFIKEAHNSSVVTKIDCARHLLQIILARMRGAVGAMGDALRARGIVVAAGGVGEDGGLRIEQGEISPAQELVVNQARARGGTDWVVAFPSQSPRIAHGLPTHSPRIYHRGSRCWPRRFEGRGGTLPCQNCLAACVHVGRLHCNGAESRATGDQDYRNGCRAVRMRATRPAGRLAGRGSWRCPG